jgi:DNA-binding NarL/FixJ family response regulator
MRRPSGSWAPSQRAGLGSFPGTGSPPRRESDRLLAALTPREREILSCLADGAGRHDVAERLHLSANTVRTHLQNLMAKLGVHSTLEAVALTRAQLSVSPTSES